MRQSFPAIIFITMIVSSACAPFNRSKRPDVPLARRPPPLIQTIQVVALADPGYEQLPAYRQRIGDSLDSLSDVFLMTFGIRLNLMSIGRWPLKSNAKLSELLEQLQRDHPVPEADLVIGWTAHPALRSQQMSDRVLSQYSRRHMVIRHLGSLFPNERHQQHSAELDALLYGVSRIFGAIGTCPPYIMSARARDQVSPRVPRWRPINLRLIRIHSTIDLRSGGPPPLDILRRAMRQFDGPDAPSTCPSESVVSHHKAMLEMLTKPTEPKQTPPKVEKENLASKARVRQHIEAGRKALKAGDDSKALRICQPIAREIPDSGAALCAAKASESLGNQPLAIKYYRAHLAFNPTHLESLARLARLVGRLGDDDAARALLERALPLAPDDIELRINLGVAYARLGEYDEARKHWMHALTVNPQHSDARKLLRQLPTQ
ncbi:MAG: tetratricopeptide repeat protein [Myxococcota bacterium]|nr:tetratricopeptide repeat protein [Myxococcota bacterium]